MIIGFLGKGGSGKSTCATLMTKFLHSEGAEVLAVDADHNMDLSYNLDKEAKVKAIGGTFLPLREKFGINIETRTDLLFTEKLPDFRFSLNPIDDYTKEYTTEIKPKLHLMMSGPQSDLVLHGSHCSHSLAAPLKIILPLFNLKENEFVVVDEKASVDAVSTGIPTGFDLSVVVAEPKEHSLRVAQQIIELLNWYEIPYVTLLNKSKDENDLNLFKNFFGKEPDFVLDNGNDSLEINSSNQNFFKGIKKYAQKVSVPNESRMQNTIKKYKRNIENC
jgi:CO dehydrogenase maturation factor